ncbi:uncharacterized protein LOC110385176 [Bombyx mori]|uniref:Uncharacterized protein n=1 Tax=Bombyx mori TaxID=7091 RepID=A0A8R2DM16_BOMMO|nr:uncharacterized protein LOC110385176 [Bombyx mori]
MKINHFLVTVLFFVLINLINEVQGARRHAELVNWFGSNELIDSMRETDVTPTTRRTVTKLKKRYKKRKPTKKKRKDKKDEKKTRNKERQEKKFVKTVVRENERAYNTSSSVESGDIKKPVDIIVHIKMHE